MAKFEKGISGNPNGRPKKENKTYFAVYAEASGVPQLPIEPTKASPNINIQYKCIPFGADNLFPQALALITRRSPVHRSIIYWKTKFIVGDSFLCRDAKVTEFIKSVNAKGESLRKVFRRLDLDYNTGGNAYMEVIKYKGGFNLDHHDFTKCRVKDIEKSTNKTPAILIHPDWKNQARSEKLTVEIPLYPNFKKDGDVERSIIHYKDYEPEYSHYGLPSWIAALDVAAIGWKTNKWNISRLDNSFRPSGVLLIQGDMSPDEATELQKLIKEQKTGEGNQGGILSIIQQVGGAATSFTPFTTTDDGDWTRLHLQANKDLVSAHNWQKSLCNQTEAVAIGNTTLIRNEYGLALVVIKDDQSIFLEEWVRVFKEVGGLDASSLQFVNKNPAPITDLLDPKAIMTIEEQRGAFGMAAFTPEQKTQFELEQEAKKKDNGTNNSSGGN